MKKILSDLNFEKLEQLVINKGFPKFRAKQLFTAVMNHQPLSKANIDASLRSNLLEEYEDLTLEIIKHIESEDKTVKFLFKLCDGNLIEGVLMRYKYGNTVCISTQVGCRMGCDFCASGKNGLVRNLTAGEMLSQVAAVNRFDGGSIANRKITNIVLMGSGEPLDNYDNTVEFLKNINAAGGLNISLRNISLSTCGLADRIIKFSGEGLPVNLTVSLHSAFDEERSKIMPAAKKYKLEDILKACDIYFEKTKRRYIFEYSLINGVNDRLKDVDKLAELLKGRPCHLNLIRLNEVKETALFATDEKSAYKFLGLLEKEGLSVSMRRKTGADIDGACGQLRNKFVGDKSLENIPK